MADVNVIFVGNLAPNVTETDLASVFDKYGMVISVVIKETRGFAFVSFENSQEASDAISADGVEIKGLPMIVQPSLGQFGMMGRGGGGGGGARGGSRGGRGGSRGGYEDRADSVVVLLIVVIL